MTSGPICRPAISGEIVASMNSPEAFAGYWKRPDADAKAIQGRWYRTGDLGKFDEDGELYIVGRVDDMIISGGENIYPEEVEDALRTKPPGRWLRGRRPARRTPRRQSRGLRRAGGCRTHAGTARPCVPERRPGAVQAAERICLGQSDPALRLREAAPAQIAQRRIRAVRTSASSQQRKSHE